jgi:hypothetical protein
VIAILVIVEMIVNTPSSMSVMVMLAILLEQSTFHVIRYALIPVSHTNVPVCLAISCKWMGKVVKILMSVIQQPLLFA